MPTTPTPEPLPRPEPPRAAPRRCIGLAAFGLGLDDLFRLRASRPGRARVRAGEGQELHPDLARRRAVAHRHVRPQARRPRGRQGEFKPIDTAVPGLQDQRGLPQAGAR